MEGAAGLVLGAGGGVHLQVIGEQAGPEGGADMHVPGQRGGAAMAAEFGGGEAIGAEISAQAALLARDADTEPAFGVHVAVIVDGESGLAVPFGGARGEDAGAEFAGAGGEIGLEGGEAEGARVEDRRVEGGGGERVIHLGLAAI